jgi:hypothetical protein
MNVFNRLFMTLLAVVLIALAVAVIALTWTIPDDTIAWLRDATDWMARHNQDTEKGLLSLIAGVIGFLALVLVLLELLPDNGDVRVTDLSVGGAVLSTADITQRVEEAVRTVDHVVNVKASVKAKGHKGVIVLLNLDVDPDANLMVVTDEACAAATDMLTNKVHVALAAPPQARLHYRELRFKTRAVKEPVVATPPEDEDPKDAVMRIAAAPPPTAETPEIAADAPVAGEPTEVTTIATVADDAPVVATTAESIPEPVPLTASAPTEERPHETTPRT